MFTDADDKSWKLAFFARLFAVPGTLSLGGTCFFLVALPYLGAVNHTTMLDFAKVVLKISCIPGTFLIAALMFDLQRTHNDEHGNWITRTMQRLPLLSVYPHPLRWIIGCELCLWLYVVVICVREILIHHIH